MVSDSRQGPKDAQVQPRACSAQEAAALGLWLLSSVWSALEGWKAPRGSAGPGARLLPEVSKPARGRVQASPCLHANPLFLLQENLMLSILPKHVADEMLKDMKKDESQKDQQQLQ